MPHQLKEAIMEKSRPVRELALCATTPLETLLDIARIPNRNVALRLLERGDLPTEVYDVLLSREPAVRFSLANRKETPRHVLERLAQDTDPSVSEAALRTLG